LDGDKTEDHPLSATPETASIDVDGHPPSIDARKATAPSVGAQIAFTPFNHSPVTPRGKELVHCARRTSPHLVASVSTPIRSASPSRVRTFMQGRTRPEPVLVEVSDVYTRFYSCRQCWVSKCRDL
jgi:hypothetical protein